MKSKKIPTFHAFTIKHKSLVNRIRIPNVYIMEAFDFRDPPPDSSIKKHKTIALWDTGATNSIITIDTAKTLGLTPTGAVNLEHARGIDQTKSYIVNIGLPNGVGIEGVMVGECESISGNFGAIIGMDIITKGDSSITNQQNCTCLSFRIPSINTIDYVVEANRMKYAGVGRNDPCPCGKKNKQGKPIKFKHCCGRTANR